MYKGVAVLLMVMAWAPALAAPLRAPNGFYLQDWALHRGGSSYRCPEVTVYQGVLRFPSHYEGAGAARDSVNPQAMAAYASETAPIIALQQLSSGLSDRLFKGNGSQVELDCLLQHWRAWARAGALESATEDPVGRAVRQWTLAALASSYLKLQLNLGSQLATDDRSLMAGWLSRLAWMVQQDYSRHRGSQLNNIDYWAAWSVQVTAVVVQQPVLMEWAWQRYQEAMAEVTDDGYLPNELRRRTRAAIYHNFALQPLVSMALFAQANQYDPLSIKHQALTRLARQVLHAWQDPTQLVQRAGVAQTPMDGDADSQKAWLAPYFALTKDPELISELQAMAALKSSRLGGDLAYLYLRPSAQSNGAPALASTALPALRE